MASLPAPVALDVFEAFYTHHYGFVWSVLRRYGIEGATTDDAAQDTFVIAFRRYNDFRGRSRRTWLYGIARRVASNYRRSTARGLRREQAFATVAASDAGLFPATLDTRIMIEKAVHALPHEDRELFFLAEVDGLSGPELAEILGTNQNTIYWRITRMRHRLADVLGDRVPAAVLKREDPEVTERGWLALVPQLLAPSSPLMASSTVTGTMTWLGLTLGATLFGAASGVLAYRAVHAERPEVEANGVPSLRRSPGTLPPSRSTSDAQTATGSSREARPTVVVRSRAPALLPASVLAGSQPASSGPASASTDLQAASSGAAPASTDSQAAASGPAPVSTDSQAAASGPLSVSTDLQAASSGPAPVSTDPQAGASVSTDSLAVWNKRLQAAMQSLRAGRPLDALELTEPPREFLPAPLDDLRIALRIEARCGLGDIRSAERDTRHFLVTRPKSPQRARVLKLCGTTTKSPTDSGH